MHHTYILVAEDGTTYVGATSDLSRRLRQHNAASNKGFTKGRAWKLLYSKEFSTRAEAFSFEAEIKKSPTKRKLFKEGKL